MVENNKSKSEIDIVLLSLLFKVRLQILYIEVAEVSEWIYEPFEASSLKTINFIFSNKNGFTLVWDEKTVISQSIILDVF